MPKKIGNILGLFSGAGGLDIGFHNCGFNLKACIDFDKDWMGYALYRRNPIPSHLARLFNNLC